LKIHSNFFAKVGDMMDNILSELVNLINRTDRSLVIGISGHGASGKTTFAKNLVNLLGQDEVNYINTDPYIISSTIRRNTLIDYSFNNQVHRFKMTACHPEAHHLPALERDLKMIREGLDFYTIDTHYSPSTIISAKNTVSIVEGMSVAFINPNLFDLGLYFYTDGETELYRRSGRDVIERGIDINYLRESHEERRIQYELFMHEKHENFDIVIKNSNEDFVVEKNKLFN
jgi:uridine kinase